LARLQAVTEEIITQVRVSPVIRMALTPLRASVPQITVDVNQTQAETLGVVTDKIYQTIQSYPGSSFVNLFTKFGHSYMVYAQADAPYRLETDNLKTYNVRNQNGDIIPLGTVAAIKEAQGAPVI